MKRIGIGSTLALCLLSLATPPALHAQAGSASGILTFLMEDELPKHVEFDVTSDEKGTATGSMIFTDQAKIPDFDDPEDPREGDPPAEFVMKAQIDTMEVLKNRAVMNGIVLDSSHVNYIGSFVQLVVEDNPGNPEQPDRLMWRFCRRQPGGWIPSDAELKDDQGAFLHWWATDAERKDDVGIPSPNLIPGEETSCQPYVINAYSFADLLKSDGDIIVKP